MSSPLADAQLLFAAGEFRQSAIIAQALIRREPANSSAWHLLSALYMRLGHLATARSCAERAVALAPTNPAFLIQYGQCLVVSGQRRDALHVADRAAAMNLNRADWNDVLGTLLTFCEEPTRALPFFRRAVELSPLDSNLLYNLAAAQRMTGDLSAAEASLNRVIAIRPDDSQAYHMRASLRTQTPEANHIDEMTRRLRQAQRTPLDEVTLCFALAKELEDTGNYQTSFRFLKRANHLQRRQIKYNVEDDVTLMDRIVRLHDRAAVNVDVGFQTEECIFVIGLPRSGTTLVERILTSHSNVKAAGELPAFPYELSKAVRSQSGAVIGPTEIVQRALDVDPAALGRAYIDATRPQTGGSPHFVDKLPLNYLNAGLIRRALPRARIVALMREPMDSCYAIYKTLFAGAYPFSYDLLELGQYYAAWHRLMRHWCDVLGDTLLVVHYEDLVTHQEAISRRIVAHCGLAWQDECLAFYQQSTAVTTASAAQIRQPMYSSSVGKWRHLESELFPLIETLRRHEPACGWDVVSPRYS
jgi:tetratricopeptide (TPR) repeat protein